MIAKKVKPALSKPVTRQGLRGRQDDKGGRAQILSGPERNVLSLKRPNI